MVIETAWSKFWDFAKEITGKVTYVEILKNLIGEENIEKIEEYVKNNPEIKLVYCDDKLFNTSILLLIPNELQGISFIFIPQSTYSHNYFFFSKNRYTNLVQTLKDLSYIYD